MIRYRNLRLWFVVWTLTWCGSPLVLPAELPAEIDNISEYELKAAFLYNIARFVEWPKSEQGGEVNLCILGEDPFGESIDAVAVGRQIRGKPIAIRRLRNHGDVSLCNVLFISRSERRRFDDVIRSLDGTPILTVGDSPSFTGNGGMINLEMKGPRITFSVNLAASKRSDIYISSKLLALARIVHRGKK